MILEDIEKGDKNHNRPSEGHFIPVCCYGTKQKSRLPRFVRFNLQFDFDHERLTLGSCGGGAKHCPIE